MLNIVKCLLNDYKAEKDANNMVFIYVAFIQYWKKLYFWKLYLRKYRDKIQTNI